MRTEANIEQWRDLYEIAMKLKLQSPWKYLWDLDLVTIILPEYKQPFFCSVMGGNGECYAIAVYEGYDGINDLYQIADSKDIPVEQLVRYQNNLICYFGDRDELTKKERQVLKDLGIKFRGRNEWIYFRFMERGYAPFMPEEDQVIKLTMVFRQLFMAMRALIEKRIKVDFEQGSTLLRQYDEEKGLWLTGEAPFNIPSRKYGITVIQDDLLIMKLKKKKRTAEEIEIDTLCLNAIIKDKDFERPLQPLMAIIGDHKSGEIFHHKILSPSDDETYEILSLLINYIFNLGRPQKVYVRDGYTVGILSDICEKTEISIQTRGSLPAIDEFAEELYGLGC